MPTKLNAPNNMVNEPVNTMSCCVKFLVPKEFSHKLDELYGISKVSVKRMLKNRKETSSKFYPEIPCVIAKSLITKYQRNRKCKAVKSLVLPICGDKGRQIKLEETGVRIPSVFQKTVVPVPFRLPISGHVRQVEFFKTGGKWIGSLCYDTVKAFPIKTLGVIGVDRNSVGNIAVLADPHNGKVRKLGICPARTKISMRGRRKNLQKARQFRLLSKVRRKQRRRMTHENHRVSKSVVDYAIKHRRAVVIEDLKGVTAPGSKIRRYSEKNQWAFAQLETFLRYKCALHGIPLLTVNPAYTSQTCSKCGNIHKPNGKKFSCGSCGQTTHRDVNASFVIAKRGLACIGGSSDNPNVLSLRCNGDAQKISEGVSGIKLGSGGIK